MQKNHYSLFLTEDHKGRSVLINLDKITHISLDEGTHSVYLSDCEVIDLCAIDGDRLVGALNIFLGVKHSTHHVLNACNSIGPTPQGITSGLRLEEFLVSSVTCSQMRWEEEV